MKNNSQFEYSPSDEECEKASNAYIVSMLAFTAGVPLPIMNLIASFIFLFNNRKSTYFVRWHCLQIVISQMIIFFINSTTFWWTVSIFFEKTQVSNDYIAFLISAILLNVFEIISTVFTAIKVRKGQHVNWYLFGDLTDVLCKP